ncbi:MAG: hypothetical protein CL917_14990 [Deltaproteobacteria bacterium]|nr:hypothetical protein [Deltaproteobacteria bacterium]
MDQEQIVSIESQCKRLTAEYCHFVDHGEAARVADLFTKDGVWASAEVSFDGRDAIRTAMTYRQKNTQRMSRHVCNNFLLTVIDADHAQGTVYLTLYRHDGQEDRAVSPLHGPVMVGEYKDQFLRTSEGWRFSRREVEVSFLKEGEGMS